MEVSIRPVSDIRTFRGGEYTVIQLIQSTHWVNHADLLCSLFVIPDSLPEVLPFVNRSRLNSEIHKWIESLSLIHISEPTRPY